MNKGNAAIFAILGTALIGAVALYNAAKRPLGDVFPAIQQIVVTSTPFSALTTRDGQDLYLPNRSVTSLEGAVLNLAGCNGANTVKADVNGNLVCLTDVTGAAGSGNTSTLSGTSVAPFGYVMVSDGLHSATTFGTFAFRDGLLSVTGTTATGTAFSYFWAKQDALGYTAATSTHEHQQYEAVIPTGTASNQYLNYNKSWKQVGWTEVSGIPATFEPQTTSVNAVINASGTLFRARATCATANAILYCDANNVCDCLAPNTTDTPQMLHSVSNGAPYWDMLSQAGVSEYYLFNWASGIATESYTAAPLTPTGTTVSITKTSLPDGDTLMGRWTTATGVPNVAAIPEGTWELHAHGYKSASLKDVVFYSVFYTRSATGTMVRVGATHNSALLTTASAAYDAHISTSTQVIATTTRLEVLIYANVSGVGTAPDVTLEVDNGANSHFATPANTVSVLNFVPYTGAVRDVDLGTYGLKSQSLQVYGLTGYVKCNSTVASCSAASTVPWTEVSGIPTYFEPQATSIDARVSASSGIPHVAPTDDTFLVGNGTVWQAKSLPPCAVGNYLYYDETTNTTNCGSLNTWYTSSTTLALIVNGGASGMVKITGSVLSSATDGTDFTLITAQSCAAGTHLQTAAQNGDFTCGNDPTWASLSGDTNVKAVINASTTIAQTNGNAAQFWSGTGWGTPAGTYGDANVNALINASSTISFPLCAAGQIVEWSGTKWACGADDTGAATADGSSNFRFFFGGSLTGGVITPSSTNISVSSSDFIGLTANVTSVKATSVTSTNIAASTRMWCPVGDNPTLDGEGQIAVDTSESQFLFRANANDWVLSATRSISISFTSSTDFVTNDTIKEKFWLGVAPFDLTIKRIYCAVDAGTQVIGIYEGSNVGAITDLATNGVDGTTTITCDTDGQYDDGSLSNSAIDKTDVLGLHWGAAASSPRKIVITVEYQVTRK